MIWVFAATLWFGIATLRVPSRWCLTAFEIFLFAIAAILTMKRRGTLRLDPVGLLLAAAAVWGILQIGLGSTVEVQHTLESVLHWTTSCAAFSVALTLSNDPARRQRFLTAQSLFALALSVICVVWFFAGGALGPFVYRNQFAAYVESVLGLAIVAAIRDRRRSVWWMLAAALLFASVVAGGSRAGTILCLLELVALPLVAFARGWISGRLLARVAVLSVAAAGLMIAVVGWEPMQRRFEEPRPYALRADLVRSTLAMMLDRPVLGFGLGTWSDAYPAYARFDDGLFANQAHNDWAQWAAEGGVPFLMVMAAIVAMLTGPALRSVWGLGLMAVFLHAFVDYPFQQRPALAAFFFAMAGALAAERPTE